MIYRRMDDLRERVSALCLGTMNFGAAMDEGTCFQVMDAYREMGGNFIDTARLYGEPDGVGFGASERVVGKWLKARGCRQQVILATKGGHPPLNDMDRGRLDRASIEADLNASLRDLGTEHIDLYWLHRDDQRLPVEEILYTLNHWIGQGKIGAIGASNWRPQRLEQARQAAEREGLTGFCADQPMWSLAHNADQADLNAKRLIQMDGALYSFHRQSGMACVPYTSQAKGFFSKLSQGGESALSIKARERYLTADNLRLFDSVRAIEAESGLSAGAVSLAYLTNQPFATFPIVGLSRLSQMADMRQAADAHLAPEQLKVLLDGAGLTA